MYIAGIVSFVFFFADDVNDWKLHNRYLKLLFPVGVLFMVISTILFCLSDDFTVQAALPLKIAVGIICLGLLTAEVYSLFFSFDSGEAYADTGFEKRPVYTERMYALCRHPGVLFCILLYGGLIIALEINMVGAAILCLLNVALIIFEDALVFPDIFQGYDEYKKKTPFLIPTGRSIGACIGDFRKR